MSTPRIIYYQYFTTPLPDLASENAASWFLPWSEPVRFRVIHVSQIVSGCVLNPDQPLPPVAPWFANLAEPVRLPIGLRSWYQQFETKDTLSIPLTDTILASWYPHFSEPVRLPIGTRAPYHYPFFAPPRNLPTPDIIMTMTPTETNEDVFLGGIYVYDSVSPTPANSGAAVTITEIPVQSDGAISIGES